MDIEIKRGTFALLPPPPDCCQVCAAPAHGDEMPHNRDSLFYQTWFQQTYGRAATWADASLACPPQVRANLKAYLEEMGVRPEAIGNFEFGENDNLPPET